MIQKVLRIWPHRRDLLTDSMIIRTALSTRLVLPMIQTQRGTRPDMSRKIANALKYQALAISDFA